MNKSLIPEETVYELFLKDKEHKEDMRDKINNYYTSLLTAVVGVAPVTYQYASNLTHFDKNYIIRLTFIGLSIIGIVLSTTWQANIKRLLYHLEFLDKEIENIEKKNNINFISYINKQTAKGKWPERVTRYQLILPYLFIIIFILTIVYSVSWMIF